MPTTSSFSKSLNSTDSSDVSSPPNTRCSNCFASVSLMPKSSPSCEHQRLVANQREKRLVTRTPGGDQRAMQRVGAIVNEGLTRERGQCAAGLVHQKIGSRKVPVVAVMRGKREIERACGDARQPQRERKHLRFHDEVRRVPGEPLQHRLWARGLYTLQARPRPCRTGRGA